jgi:integrase
MKARPFRCLIGWHAWQMVAVDNLLIRHSESVKVVQARLGHASASETLDTYSHLWPDSDDRTRTAVDSVLLADSVRTGEVVYGRNS